MVFNLRWPNILSSLCAMIVINRFLTYQYSQTPLVDGISFSCDKALQCTPYPGIFKYDVKLVSQGQLVLVFNCRHL